MKAIVLFAISLFAATASQAELIDPTNGQRLFQESRCLSCHGSEVFTRPARLVKSLAQLEQQVRRCDANLSTNWFDDQILDVVAYLNQAYYKFPTPVTMQRLETPSQ